MNTKKLSVLSIVCCAFSALFSFASLSFHGDISLAAFPLALVYTAVIAYVSCIQLFKKGNIGAIPAVRELYQYEPFVLLIAFVLRRAGEFGTNHVLDAVTVVLWFAVAVLSIIILHYLNPKHVYQFDESWKMWREANPPVQLKGVKRVLFEIVSWADALVQAVFMVLLLNIFIVQLYEIPSESMVPEFLIKDRVIVFKTLSGPKFPLSDIGFPYVKQYKRGDIVVFRNPHYENDRKSEVKTFVSQLVYMITLTSVNINTDADGNPKADPLVKRITGVPGEQLLLQDGVLYVRTSSSDEFKPVEKDNSWASWNLNEAKSSLRNGIRQYPLTQEQYDSMIECEKQRNELDTASAAEECKKIAQQFMQVSSGFAVSKNTASSSSDALFSDTDKFEYTLFSQNENVTAKLLSSEGGKEWFNSFMTSWIGKNSGASGIREGVTGAQFVGGNMYDDANFRLNVMIKITLGKLIVRNAQLLKSNVPPSKWNDDEQRIACMKEAEMENNYVMLLDRRNMPIFPANDKDGNPQYIPANNYFMMGDNRFNSLDMRHSYEEVIAPLTPYDEYSVTYYTNMKPQYVNRSRILGTTAYRFWPASRMGIPGHTGK